MINYQGMLDFLYSLQKGGIKFGLKKISLALKRLGRPQKSFLTVHIGGTKGKGSTAAFLHYILSAAGYRCGLYTSPHLLDFRERYIVDRRKTSQQSLVAAFEDVCSVTGKGADIPLTFFEWVTAMAFLVFARSGVEVAVFEAGMGGRLDATRVAGGPITLFSHIGLDHQEYLGSSLSQIAYEKAGLIGKGSLVISVPQRGEVSAVLRNGAARHKASFIDLKDEADIRVHGTDIDGLTFDYRGGGRALPRLYVPLPGRHQADNAALAIMGAISLENHGLAIEDKDIYGGLAETRWPGRLQGVGRNPEFILDVAHNPDSIASLRDFLGECYPGVRYRIVLAIMADKDMSGMLDGLLPLGGELFITRCRTDRSAGVKELAALAKSRRLTIAGSYDDVPSAVRAAAEGAGDEGLVVVTGSLFTVGEAMKHLKGRGLL